MPQGATKPLAAISPGSFARRLRCERGFTLVELLVAMTIAIFVFAAITSFMVVSLGQSNSISSRSETTSQAETELEAVVSDLREAFGTVTVSDPTSAKTEISFGIPTPGSDATAEPITLICPSSGATAAGTCTLTVNGSSRREIVGVDSATFSPVSSSGASMPVSTSISATNPAYIGIQLKVQVTSRSDPTQTHSVAGTQPVLVQTGADLWNQQ